MNWLLYSIKALFNLKKPQGTVRYMFSAAFGITILLAAATITSTDVSYVRLEASKTTIENGESFSLDVYAFAHVPVNAVDITLRFDENAVEVLGVNKGQSVLTIWTQEPIIEADKVVLRGGTFRRGFLNEHRIATINLRARNTGQSTLSAADVMLLAGDGTGSSVSVAESLDSNVSLYIYDENIDPGSIGADIKVSIVTDIDGDGKVTLKDISVFMAAWAKKTKIFDFNGDGRMTLRDFSIILADFFFI
jgi:hypothetical protein